MKMMMMDIGMYGHGQHNGVYPTDSNYYNYSSDVPTNHPQLASTHYNNSYHFDEASSYLYTPTNDSLETPPSPQDLYYHHHQPIHQENPIINTDSGLSYTNLDYGNSSNGNPAVYPQNSYNETYHQRSHHHQEMLMRHHDDGTDGQQTHHGFLTSENKYQLDLDGNYHPPHPHVVATPSSSCMESYQHLHRYKDEGVQDAGRIRPHVMHNLGSVPAHQPVLPTYKWMQVKRNVPKPAGEQIFQISNSQIVIKERILLTI